MEEEFQVSMWNVLHKADYESNQAASGKHASSLAQSAIP